MIHSNTSVEALREILRTSEGKTYEFTFVDGSEMIAKVISTTHVDENDTVVLLRDGALPEEPAWNVELREIRVVITAKHA